ncbi:MAG: DUF4354 family protein [Chloroflexi bacterium]|nr:DUF4354 family protein [Chloroflexota bacterium]
MKRPPRIPVWYLVLPVATLALGYWIGGGLNGRAQPTPARLVTPIVISVPALTPRPTEGTLASGAPTGPTRTPTPGPRPPIQAKVGERIEVEGLALIVHSVRRTDSLSPYTQAKPGEALLVLDVAIENVSRSEADYGIYYFRLRDPDGFELSARGIGVERSLKAGKLHPGERVRGDVAFDVPLEPKGHVLQFRPRGWFDSAEIRVPIEN